MLFVGILDHRPSMHTQFIMEVRGANLQCLLPTECYIQIVYVYIKLEIE